MDPVQEKRRRGCSFWKPSKKTEQLLQQYKQGSVIPEPTVLTSPSVLVETQMVFVFYIVIINLLSIAILYTSVK